MTGGPPIDAYLRQVAATMPGPARARRDILAELRSGLLDTIDAHRSAGLPAGAAAVAAITEFGDPRQIAGAFERAARRARSLPSCATGEHVTVGGRHQARSRKLRHTHMTADSALGCQHGVVGCGTSACERRRPPADWSR
jgi:hypothetical protein